MTTTRLIEEVYKARDTRLDRTVAIKVLPETLAADPQFRERFDREARAISQLDHPHICALYDVGEQDGKSFLVMQYLEGVTLQDRLARAEGLRPRRAPAALAGVGSPRELKMSSASGGGAPRAVNDAALPISEALTIAIQIASALDKAHRAGIIHRDLKPGNVMLTRAGAKLLDFGLSKTSAPAVAGAGLSMLPTTPFGGAQGRPAGLTAQGTILGTFQYMAPEQLEGQDADARTDIFAFGAVLYEMLTGKKAFEGKTHASLIGAIMHADPPPVSTIQPLTPPALDRVVRKCLAKEPDARWQTASDLHDELMWIADVGAKSAMSTPSARATPRLVRLTWMFAVIAAVATTAAIVLGLVHLRNGSVSGARPIRFTVAPPPNATLGTGGFALPAVSPDGRRLAFVAFRGGDIGQLWVRSVDAIDAQPLLGTEGTGPPFWSPDSRSLAFWAGGKLKTIDASGGPVRSVCDVPAPIAGGTWSKDGTIVFGSGGGLLTVSLAGGSPTPLTLPGTNGDTTQRGFPSFLPEGRHLLYWATPSNTVWLTSLDGGTPQRLLAADSPAVYADPGYLFFVRQGTLLAQLFDARRGTVSSEAVPIAEQILTTGGGAATAFAFAVSPTGVLAYRSGALGVRTQLMWTDRTGRTLGVIGEPRSYRNPELSPDGTRVAVEVIDAQSRMLDVWLMELARGVTSRFTFDPTNDSYPIWSPDGNWIMFGSDRGGVLNLYQKRANGAGGEEVVLKSAADMVPWSWSPDARFVVYRSTMRVIKMGILPLTGERTPHLLELSKFNEAQGQISPDGRWLAYTSNESGRFEVYVQSFPAPGGGKWQISREGGTHLRWRRDGRELFYIARDGRLMAVPISGTTALEVGAAIPLFAARVLNGAATNVGSRQQYDVARDGQRFLLNVPLDDASTASPITVVVNWAAGLKK